MTTRNTHLPTTIANARHHGYTARLLGDGVMGDARMTRWQMFDAEGRYLTELLCAVEPEGEETVYWLSPSIRYSDDIEQLRQLSAQAAIRETGAA